MDQELYCERIRASASVRSVTLLLGQFGFPFPPGNFKICTLALPAQILMGWDGRPDMQKIMWKLGCLCGSDLTITIRGANFAISYWQARASLTHTIVSSKFSAQGTMGGYHLWGPVKGMAMPDFKIMDNDWYTSFFFIFKCCRGNYGK